MNSFFSTCLGGKKNSFLVALFDPVQVAKLAFLGVVRRHRQHVRWQVWWAPSAPADRIVLVVTNGKVLHQLGLSLLSPSTSLRMDYLQVKSSCPKIYSSSLQCASDNQFVIGKTQQLSRFSLQLSDHLVQGLVFTIVSPHYVTSNTPSYRFRNTSPNIE